jgi:SurA N-terminal domain
VTRVLPRRIAGAALAGLVGLAVPALTACEPDQPGSAAIVGDQRITEAELQGSVRAIIDLKREAGQQVSDTGALVRQVLARQVESILVAHAAAAEGIEVSEGEVSKSISQVRSGFADEAKFRAALADNNIAPADFERFAEFNLQVQKLADRLGGANDPATAQKYNQLLLSIGNEEGVQISPRYGSWDPAKGPGEPKDDLSQSGSLEPSSTEPAPAPR